MKSVLFVDDNETLCKLSCDILRRQGYRVVGALNGADALKAFEREHFDLVVTDMRMEGMDGLELARTIHERKPAVPVIMVTGYDPVESDILRACLPKEGMFPALLEHIRACIEQGNGSKS